MENRRRLKKPFAAVRTFPLQFKPQPVEWRRRAFMQVLDGCLCLIWYEEMEEVNVLFFTADLDVH